MTDDLDTRVRRLEAMMGLSPFTTCQGDPDLCGEACTPQSCPVQNNPLQDALTRLEHLQAWQEHLRFLLGGAGDEELEAAFRRAKVYARLCSLVHRRQKQEVDSTIPVLQQAARENIRELDAEVRDLLGELCP